MSNCEIRRTFMIECVISLFFLQVEAGVGVLNSCLLFFRGKDWSVLTMFDQGLGNFCAIIAEELLSVTQPLLASFGSGGTEA